MELKPCPFCGGEAASYKNDVFGCSSCDCWVDTAEEWNRREYPALRKLVEEIDRRGFAAVGNAEAQNALGWCSIEVEKLLKKGE